MHKDIIVNVSGPHQAASQYKTIVLKGNQSFKSQIENAQSEITKAHQRGEDLAFKFVIKFNFDLGGESVTIPEGCLLEFDGGSVSNGALVGQDTILIYNQPLNEILTATLEGTWKHEASAKADEEDITDINGDLKLKDRGTADGMGMIILRKNKSFAEQLTQTNTIYEIRYDFDLDGASVTIPANCVMEFEGGKLKNGTLVGNNSFIENNGDCFVFDNILFSGTFTNEKVYLEWFGYKHVSWANDCMNSALSFVKCNAYTNHVDISPTIVLKSGCIYRFNTTININQCHNIKIDSTNSYIYYVGESCLLNILDSTYIYVDGGTYSIESTQNDACVFLLQKSKYCKFLNMSIVNASNTYSNNNIGIYILPPSNLVNDITGNNIFSNIRFNKLGFGVKIVDNDSPRTSASRVILNKFYSSIWHCNTGVYLKGACCNYFEGDVETQSTSIIIKTSDNSLNSCENSFKLLYYAGNKCVDIDENCVGNYIFDIHSANTQSPNNSFANGACGGMLLSDIVTKYGIKRSQPSEDYKYLTGGQGSTNIIPNSNDFTRWTSNNCIVEKDNTTIDPYGNYTNPISYKITSTQNRGEISINSIIIGNNFRYRYYTLSMWIKATDKIDFRAIINQRNTNNIRNIFTFNGISVLNQWVYVTYTFKPTTSGSTDYIDLHIIPSYDGTTTINLCNVSIQEGFGTSFENTNDTPNRFYKGLIGENIISNGALFITDQSGVKKRISYSEHDDAIVGDIFINGNANVGDYILKYRNNNSYIGINKLFSSDVHNGATNQRPALTANDIGFQYFDTTPGIGKPIYWNGTAWVDATGTPV